MGLAHNLSESQRTEDIKISQNVTFDTMLLSPTTLEGLKKSGFFKPSPIQLHGIPLGKCGFDLLLEAKSGTGKTAVFTIIILEKIDINKGLQVIVLAPTREIAAQICDVIRNVGCLYDGLCVEVVMGGLPVQDDIDKFKENNVHIVVGSPGRLKHLIKDGHMDTNSVRLLVIDEADKLMEKSFLADIRSIYKTLPQQKQVIMSSATYPESSKEFIGEFVHDAQHICPSSNCVLLGVMQKVTYVEYNSNTVLQTRYRFKELLKIISKKQFKQCLIFCNYQVRVGEVHKMLTREKWPAELLYGAQDQIDRLDAIKTLQEYKCRILISTDLAARGIDASNVDLVINFEPPFDWQTYLHRIGRAGRFGSYGMAVTILSEGVEQKKFINTLAAVNLSDYLLPLWNENDVINNKDSLHSPDRVQLTGGPEDQNHTKLWDIICQNEVPSKGNVESFSELCNSFEKATTIESFSDLLDSYVTNNLSDNKDFQYKCIELPNISAKQYLGKLKNELDVDAKYSDNTCDMKTPLENISNPAGVALGDITNQVDNVSEETEEVIGEINKQLQCVSKHFADNHEQKNQLHELSKHTEHVPRYNSIEHVSKHSNDVFGIIEKELEVVSNHSGYTSNHSVEFVGVNLKKCKNRTKNACLDKTDVNKAVEMNKKISTNLSKQKLLYESVSNPSSECTQPNKQKNRSAKHTKGETAAHHNRCCSKESYSEKHKAKQTKNCSFDKSYINWYLQLKYQVRQIELACYIDELSKLY